MEVGLGPDHILLDGTQLSPQKGHSSPRFRPMSIVAKQLDRSRCHLVRRYASAQATLCYRWGLSSPSPHKGAQPPPILAYLRTKWHLDVSNRLATMHQLTYRQTGQTTVRQHRANRFTNGRPKTSNRWWQWNNIITNHLMVQRVCVSGQYLLKYKWPPT